MTANYLEPVAEEQIVADDEEEADLVSEFAESVDRFQGRIAGFRSRRRQLFEGVIRTKLGVGEGSHPVLDEIEGAYETLRAPVAAHRFAAILALLYYWPEDRSRTQPFFVELLRVENDIEVLRLAVSAVGTVFSATRDSDVQGLLDDICRKTSDAELHESAAYARQRINSTENPLRKPESLAEANVLMDDVIARSAAARAEVRRQLRRQSGDGD